MPSSISKMAEKLAHRAVPGPDIKRHGRKTVKYIQKTFAPKDEMIFDPPLDKRSALVLFDNKFNK